MDTVQKIPLSERINFRLVIFLVVVSAIVAFPTYLFVDALVSGGVKDRGEYFEVDLKALSDFPFDQINGKLEDIPQQWRDLDGKRIQVVGEIWLQNNAAPRISNFELVYSIAKCCFSGPPQIQHFVEANVVNGGTVPRYPGLVRVLGTLHVNIERDQTGKISRVYRMDVEKVEPV